MNTITNANGISERDVAQELKKFSDGTNEKDKNNEINEQNKSILLLTLFKY